MKPLYDRIMNIRALAASLFDTGLANETPKEQIAAKIKPLHDKYDGMIDLEAQLRPGEVALTITMIEKNAGSLMESSHWCRQKADAEMDYAKKLRQALALELVRSGKPYLEDAGFLITGSADGTGVEIR